MRMWEPFSSPARVSNLRARAIARRVRQNYVGHRGLRLAVSGFGAAFVGSIALTIVSGLPSLVFAPARRGAPLRR